MPDWLSDFIDNLFYGPFYQLVEALWRWLMDKCTGIITTPPQEFSTATWDFVTEKLYPWAVGLGVSLVNIFFIISFFKAASNLKENITLELCVETMIKLVTVNVMMQLGKELINTFFSIASALAGQVLSFEEFTFYTEEYDAGSVLFWWMFGIIYTIVGIVCAFMIFLTVYGRYIKLYLLMILYPLAIPALAGGRGVEQTAYAWIKSFISNVFEIVVIALVMSITSRLIQGVNLEADGYFEGIFNGFLQALNSLLYMILMASSVKGASTFLNKTLNL